MERNGAIVGQRTEKYGCFPDIPLVGLIGHAVYTRTIPNWFPPVVLITTSRRKKVRLFPKSGWNNENLGAKKTRLYFTTFLREPVDRFISEYSHVQRGATWKRSRHFCNGRSPTAEELPQCYDPEVGWEGIGLNEFIDCQHNLAFNRSGVNFSKN